MFVALFRGTAKLTSGQQSTCCPCSPIRTVHHPWPPNTRFRREPDAHRVRTQCRLFRRAPEAQQSRDVSWRLCQVVNTWRARSMHLRRFYIDGCFAYYSHGHATAVEATWLCVSMTCSGNDWHHESHLFLSRKPVIASCDAAKIRRPET